LAKILAGEYNKTEKYSMHTLQILKSLDSEMLGKFKEICSYVLNNSMIPSSTFRLNSGYDNQNFNDFLTLQTLGLILPSEIAQQTLKVKKIAISYQKVIMLFETENPATDNFNIPNYYSLSPTGNQLVKLLDVQFNKPYYKWLKSNYTLPGYKLVS
jgi:uncharacterized protein DUF2806